MARKPRNIVAGFPFHAIVRGNNHQAIFLDDEDRRNYKEILQAAGEDHGLSIHAYVMMADHMQIVGTPARPESLALVMQAVGRRYVRQFNRRHNRTGTLWEGRYRASLIQEDPYLLACLRHVEMNPVRAGMVEDAAKFPWSSHRHHLGWVIDPLVSTHKAFWALGNTPFEREAAYLRLFEMPASLDDSKLGNALLTGRPVAEDEFLARLEEDTGQQWVKRPVGRPRKPDRTGLL